MRKFRYTIDYEVRDAEVIIEAETAEEADDKLVSVMVGMDPSVPTGGTVTSRHVSAIEELHG